MCGFGNEWQSLWTNVFIEFHMKEYFIGCAWRSCVEFKYGCHEDKIYTLSIGIKIINLKRRIWYDQERRNEDGVLLWNSNKPWSSLCDKPWRIKILRVDFKRRIQDKALGRRHDRLICWAMVGRDLEHAIEWIVLYVSQDILIEHEKIQDWPIQTVEIRFKLVNTWSIKNVPHGILWYGKLCQLCFMN